MLYTTDAVSITDPSANAQTADFISIQALANARVEVLQKDGRIFVDITVISQTTHAMSVTTLIEVTDSQVKIDDKVHADIYNF